MDKVKILLNKQFPRYYEICVNNEFVPCFEHWNHIADLIHLGYKHGFDKKIYVYKVGSASPDFEKTKELIDDIKNLSEIMNNNNLCFYTVKRNFSKYSASIHLENDLFIYYPILGKLDIDKVFSENINWMNIKIKVMPIITDKIIKSVENIKLIQDFIRPGLKLNIENLIY